MVEKYKHGLIICKCLPPHAGHLHLIQQSSRQCKKLTVLMCSIKSEPIPGALRHYWLSNIFPELNVIHITDELPQYPHEHPNFWNMWIDTIRKNITPDFDAVFSSENYGEELGQRLGVTHTMIDLDRKIVPVSGTLIRSNPYKYWKYIPTIVRPYYMKKIVLTGPESTGKTFTSKKLAEHFNTLWVQEYGREYTDKKPNLESIDFSLIAGGQLYLEQMITMKASEKSKFIFCDTDLIVTQIWSQIFIGSYPQWIVEANTYYSDHDLYLLMNTDIPWVDDGTRAYANIRGWHFNRIEKELKERKLNYVIISGGYEERIENAIKAVETFVKSTIKNEETA